MEIEIFHRRQKYDLLQLNQNGIRELYDCEQEERCEKCLPLHDEESEKCLESSGWQIKFYEQYLPINNSQAQADATREHLLTRERFLLCLYLNCFKEAIQCAQMSEEPIMPYLVGAMIYRKAARLLNYTDSKRSKEFTNNAEEFSKLAGQMIDEKVVRHRLTEREQDKMLNQVDENFFNLSPLALINRNPCQGIHVSAVIHNRLHKKFYGNLNNHHSLIHLRVFLTTLFLPLLPCLVLLPSWIPFRSNKLKWRERIKHFYHAPVVRFYYSYLLYLGFLMIYGYKLVTRYLPFNVWGNKVGKTTYLKIGRSETIVHVWIWNLIVEDILEFIESYRQHNKLTTYFANGWHSLDLLGIICYLIAFLTRFSTKEEVFVASKILMSISFLLWCLRMLQLLTAYEILGWSLVLIIRMMKSLIFFFAVFIIIIFAFAVPVEALRSTVEQVRWYYSPDRNDWNATFLISNSGTDNDFTDWVQIKRLIYWGILRLFGQIEEPSRDTDVFSIFGWCLSVVFACAIHILLLNALIVIFNNVARRAEKDLKCLRRSQHAILMKKFCDKNNLGRLFQRTLMPPPLNVIYYIIRAVYIGLLDRPRQVEVLNNANIGAVVNHPPSLDQTNGTAASTVRHQVSVDMSMQSPAYMISTDRQSN